MTEVKQDRPNVEVGIREMAIENEILRTVVGSGVHGMAIEGHDDHDEMGVFIEPPEVVLGLASMQRYAETGRGTPEHYVSRTKPEGVRSEPGDTDLTIYSLRKYLRLACEGNPTVLLPLYAPEKDILVVEHLGLELRALRRAVVSLHAGWRFLHYGKQQRERMVLGYAGKGHRRLPKRPELVEAHGYDCYLDDTEFLTRRGWLPYDGISDGEPVGTIAADGTVEFQVPTDRLSKPYTGPIHYGRSRYSSWAVTPNHRMWVSKVQRGACGRDGDVYRSALAAWEFHRADEVTDVSWHQRVAGAPRQPEWPVSDAYLALIGAYVSEGCVGKRLNDGSPSVLRFDQKDGGRLHATMTAVAAEFRLRSYRYPDKRPVTTWTLADRTVALDVAKACGEGSYCKRLPEWVHVLSARQATVLLDALLSGDGSPYRTGGWVYYTVSPDLAGDVQALALVAGRRSNQWGPYAAGMFQVFIADPDPVREVEAFRPRQHLTVGHVIDSRIVCFTVPNERLVTRREGRVAMHGNTKYASHALRLALEGTWLVARGELTLPMPEHHLAACMAIKTGQVSFETALDQIDTMHRTLEKALTDDKQVLPPTPDWERVNAWMVSAHQRWWENA